MAKLRHIAMQVPDLEKSARFYEAAFDLDRVQQADTEYGNVIMLSDGVMNLTLLNFPEGTIGGVNGPDWAGLHHMGFVVDDADATAKAIEAEGGAYFMTLPDGVEGLDAEVKFKDPNGLVVDVAEHNWRQSGRS